MALRPGVLGNAGWGLNLRSAQSLVLGITGGFNDQCTYGRLSSVVGGSLSLLSSLFIGGGSNGRRAAGQVSICNFCADDRPEAVLRFDLGTMADLGTPYPATVQLGDQVIWDVNGERQAFISIDTKT